jgi:hypothetical protein
MGDTIEVVVRADTMEVIQGTSTVVEAAGATGPQGPAGAAGQGVPVGGTTGQVLRKVSDTNYDTEWGTGGGSVTFGTTAGTACEGNDSRIANIPNGTGSIALGQSGTRTTLNGAASGSDKTISLPNATGTLALTQQATDYEVTDETKGVIMKSANGTRWRVTIDNNGSLLRTALATLILSALMLFGAQAQVRDLIYGTNNVVVGPTNGVALSFTNSVAFSNPITFGTNADTVRANLGLAASWLTSATNAGFLNKYLVSAGELGELVAWADVPTVIAGSYTLKGNGDDPYNMDATNVLAYFSFVNQWRIYDAEGFKDALFESGNFILNKDGDYETEQNTTISATTIEARYYSSVNGNFGGRVKIGGINNAQWELLGGTDGNTNIVRTNYLPSVSGELVTTTLTNVSAPEARTNLGLGSLATNNSVPSGAATQNSILTADGAGSSSFIASRIDTKVTTNEFTKVSWTTNGFQQSGNLSSAPFSSWNVTQGNFYRVSYSVRFESTVTNGMPAHGIVAPTNVLGGTTMHLGAGVNTAGTISSISVTTNSTQTWWTLPPPAAVGSRTITGSFIFYAYASTTVVYSWAPSANVTNEWRLLVPSMVTLEKL